MSRIDDLFAIVFTDTSTCSIYFDMLDTEMVAILGQDFLYLSFILIGIECTGRVNNCPTDFTCFESSSEDMSLETDDLIDGFLFSSLVGSIRLETCPFTTTGCIDEDRIPHLGIEIAKSRRISDCPDGVIHPTSLDIGSSRDHPLIIDVIASDDPRDILRQESISYLYTLASWSGTSIQDK